MKGFNIRESRLTARGFHKSIRSDVTTRRPDGGDRSMIIIDQAQVQTLAMKGNAHLYLDVMSA
jgi:hypothetical protein